MTMRSYHIFLLGLVALFAVSCGDPVQQRVDALESYIEDVESESESYTAEEWEAADMKIEQLRAEVEANYDAMTPEQQQAALKAIGRYYGLVAKRGISEFAKEAQKALESVPSFIEGFTDAFKSDEQ